MKSKLLLLVVAVLFGGAFSGAFAQTPVLIQHKLSGDSVCAGKATCTVPLSSPTVAGHALLLGIAGAGFTGFPVTGTPSGDSAWTHCSAGMGQYVATTTDYIFSDCWYILSAAGGAKSISVTFSGETASQIENMDVDVMEVGCSTSCVATYDDSNNKVFTKVCSTCASEVLSLTGNNDAIMQIGNFVGAYGGIGSPYSVLDIDTRAENAFGYVLDDGSGAAVNWSQNGSNQAVFAGLAIKFSPAETGAGTVSYVLTPSANSLIFSGMVSEANPASQTLKVTSSTPCPPPSGVPTCNWPITITSNQPWLTVSSGTGNAPATFQISANTSGLSSGTLEGALTITSTLQNGEKLSNSPVTIPVTLALSNASESTLSCTMRTGNSASDKVVCTIGGFGAGQSGTMTWTPSNGGSAASASITNP